MTQKLYKYINPEFINKIFPSHEKSIVRFKCSYPKDFNDPYELSLTINDIEDPKLLAFYSDVIGKLPQLPTTCFSRSPSIIPMWAHYAHNLQGFVIELDEEKLKLHFPASEFGNVNYQDEPDDSIKENLYQAYGTTKPRHTYILIRSVLGAAYFTKSTYWSHEIERRMIVNLGETTKSNGLILINIPPECVISIICGPRATSEVQRILQKQAEIINCRFFKMKIGHCSSIPFFLDNEGNPHIFKEENLIVSTNFCSNCKEPLYINAQKCSWCMINDLDRVSAAMRNPYRMLDQYGMLDSYIDSMNKVE